MPKDVKFCTKCNLSNQRPTSTNEFKHDTLTKQIPVAFNKDNICSACETVEKKFNATINFGKKLNKKEPRKGVDVFFFGKSLIPLFFVKGETERFSFYTKINKATSSGVVLDIQNEK